MPPFTETVSPDGLRLAIARGPCMVLTRLGPGLVLMSASGHDKGDFGSRPFEWLESEMGRHGRIEIFVDMRELFNATQTVADGWSKWIGRHRSHIARMSLLVSSKYVQMTVEVAKLFSRTGELMRVYTDAPTFSDAISQALGRTYVLGPVKL